MHAFDRKLNLLIGTPDMGMWEAHYGASLTNMMNYLDTTPVPGYRDPKIQPMQIHGSILSRARHQLQQYAIRDRCTHLLFIDADQDFPRDTAHRLLAAGKDVVGCNIATKQYPANPTARRKSGLRGEQVFTDLDSPQLEKVWRLGCGIMLVSVRVLEAIGPGCWEIRWKPELSDYQGEDWSMCEAMEAAGYEIWVDHQLSNEIGHWGPFRYSHDFVGEKRIVEVADKPPAKLIGEA